MIATGITDEQLRYALSGVSEALYGKNLRWNREPQWLGYGHRFTIRVVDSKGPGAARSTNGRRLVSACWHAHRDFLAQLFAMAPYATVTTALLRYKGAVEFARLLEDTGDTLIGTPAKPMPRRAACECDE